MINVLSSGFYTTVQDLGRNDYQSLGVPISGAMDHCALKMANAILGNDENCAVLEITLVGPKLEFTCNSLISITGAELPVKLNSDDIQSFTAINVVKGDVLSFGRFNNGYRSYLGVYGGFQTELVLNSRSLYAGLTTSSCLKKGDILKILPKNSHGKRYSNVKFNKNYIDSHLIDVYKGPEFDNLNDFDKDKLLNQEFTISKDNNRMAYQLEETLPNELGEMITSLVLPGTIQLTPLGKLIVLMRDCQTTGGYPRVLQLSESSINVFAQKKVGDKITFKIKSYNQ